jgi:hypothetical protein
MAVIAVLGALCALAVVVLACVVARLSAQVRRLSSELVALASPATRSAPAESAAPMATAVPPTPVDAFAPMPDGQAVDAEPGVSDEDVPVITDLPDADDDLDITARRVASVTFARPLIKVAALSYGLRRALDDENRFKIRYAMRQEFRRQGKMRRRRRAGRAPSMGWRA